MKKNEIKLGHSYKHRTHGTCAIVGCHPHDGAALVACYMDKDEDEEKYVLCVPEDFLEYLPNEMVFRSEDGLPAIEYIERMTDTLIEEAKHLGVVVTISLKPLKPLAMGHYEMTPDFRPKRGTY